MKYETHGMPCRVIRRTSGRVLVIVEGWPFPRWLDAAEVIKRQPAPFEPALF
jgi:hypothetical protein